MRIKVFLAFFGIPVALIAIKILDSPLFETGELNTAELQSFYSLYMVARSIILPEGMPYSEVWEKLGALFNKHCTEEGFVQDPGRSAEIESTILCMADKEQIKNMLMKRDSIDGAGFFKLFNPPIQTACHSANYIGKDKVGLRKTSPLPRLLIFVYRWTMEERFRL